MPTLKEDFDAAMTALRGWLSSNAPELATQAEGVVTDVETAGKAAADAAVTSAVPVIAPEVVPALNGLLDDADKAIDDKLASDIAALTATAEEAKAKNAATRAAISAPTVAA